MTYDHVDDYLFHMEALSNREARRLWRQSIKDSWHNCCAYCGKPPIDDKSLTLDHVKAKSKGGEDLRTNIVPADKRCNAAKGSEEWRSWYHQQPFYEEWREFRIDYWLKYNIVLSEEQAQAHVLSGHFRLDSLADA